MHLGGVDSSMFKSVLQCTSNMQCTDIIPIYTVNCTQYTYHC